jgi:hypothetical protein
MRLYQQASGRLCKRGFILAILSALFYWTPAWSQPLPLPADVQAKVDKAIDAGVAYLKSGMWPTDKNHVLGYVALPGLTLLECGVPANNPGVQNAAAFVRGWCLKIDTTYEIALSILFLDKLGEAKDRELIQKLALRLIAGQGPTGGWSYKCPPYDKDADRYYKQLLSTLKKLDMPVLFDPLAQASPGEIATETRRQGDKEQGRTGESAMSASHSAGSRNWAWCIKMEGAGDSTPSPASGKPKVVVIPRNLQALPVLHPPAALPLIDPKDKINEPIWGTTDNSNTQFAILALWAARRHQVPTARTLNLIAMRFYTSQNADGSWGYHYRFGGGEAERPPMTCVGLLGLAVYHGLARDMDVKAMKGQDERIVKGLLALTKNVGMPTGRTEGLPMANLYFLWSVERVGVLYDLPTIGNKEWYRWGAEILVANQTRNGNWENGGYHGANPTIDTCLALLFLKRANLAKDLTKALPFKPAALSEEVAKKLPQEPAVKEAPPKFAPKVELTASDPLRSPAKQEKPSTAAAPAARPGPSSDEPIEEKTGKAWIWLVAILTLLMGSGVVLALIARKSESDEDDEEEIRRRPRNRKRARSESSVE